MCGRIRSEFYCFEGYDKNSNFQKSNVWKDKVETPMLKQCNKTWNVWKDRGNSTVWKDKS